MLLVVSVYVLDYFYVMDAQSTVYVTLFDCLTY